MADGYFAYVGTFTTAERHARGDGVHVYRVDSESARWTHLQHVPGLENPSFLALDRSRSFLYSVHGDGTQITAFAIDPVAGTLTLIGDQGTGGTNPVHLVVDPTNRFVVVANYATSTLALMPRNDDGSIGPVVDLARLEGDIGPHRIEQPYARPHQVALDPSGEFIVVPDKGLDCVFTYRIDHGAGKLVPAGPAARTRENSGPRHVAFHPAEPWAYVLDELGSTVTAYRMDRAGMLQAFQILPSLPDTFTGNSRASEIEISADGRFVLASNRGHDSIAVFAVDRDSGRLTARQWRHTGGTVPRFFALDPTQRYLFAANEGSDSIVTFRFDAESGRLDPTGQLVDVCSPACIVFKTG